MKLEDEQDFTRKAIHAFEFDLEARPYAWDGCAEYVGHLYGGVVVDAKGNTIAMTDEVEQAEVIATLLNWAIRHYPFRHPDDPGIVNTT